LLFLAAASGCVGRSQVTHQEPPQERPVVAVAAHEDPPSPPVDAPRAAPEPIGRCDAQPDVAHFTLAHVNDMQARYEELVGGRSRYAYVAGYLRALKEQVPETIVLDAGDDYEKGALADLRSMGEATRQMLQALPIDARTIGNHDFAYGAEAVLRDVAKSAHPVLAANVRRSGDDGPFVPFVKLEVGCVRVGIVGLVTGNYAANDQPSREAFDGVFVHDDRYESVLGSHVKAHRGEVDVMIALDHLGFYEDVGLALRVPGVDLVVGGHSEDLVRQPYALVRPDGSRAWVMQAGHYARTIGRADIAVKGKDRRVSLEKYRLINVDESLPYSEEVAELARRLEREYTPGARTPIGVVREGIGAGAPMGDLVWRAVHESWGVDGIVLGRDVFWDGLPKGPVTLQRLYDSVLVQREPAGTSGFSSLWELSLSGADVRRLRAKFTGGAVFTVVLPEPIATDRTYRIAIEKRALEFPRMAFAGTTSMPPGRFAGEIIDALEAYAHARSERGLVLN
jgi:hypothetical protein